LTAVTVAVRFADPPAATDVGDAASVTEYAGTSTGGRAGSLIVTVPLPVVVADEETDAAYVPALP